MPVHPWPHLLKRLKKGHVVLGLDVGSTTLGVAISDPGFLVATALTTLTFSKADSALEALATLAHERMVGGYVIGLPLHDNDRESESSRRARHFASRMEQQATLFPKAPEISFFDERYSTAGAESFLTHEAGLNKFSRDAVIDKMAAQIILQDALNAYQKSLNP